MHDEKKSAHSRYQSQSTTFTQLNKKVVHDKQDDKIKE